jgi:hypothetical protein
MSFASEQKHLRTLLAWGSARESITAALKKSSGGRRLSALVGYVKRRQAAPSSPATSQQPLTTHAKYSPAQRGRDPHCAASLHVP